MQLQRVFGSLVNTVTLLRAWEMLGETRDLKTAVLYEVNMVQVWMTYAFTLRMGSVSHYYIAGTLFKSTRNLP